VRVVYTPFDELPLVSRTCHYGLAPSSMGLSLSLRIIQRVSKLCSIYAAAKVMGCLGGIRMLYNGCNRHQLITG
jgi:hypothetical protein